LDAQGGNLKVTPRLLDQSAEFLVATLHQVLLLIDFDMITLIDPLNFIMASDDSGTRA
jgi:hypothetical protein